MMRFEIVSEEKKETYATGYNQKEDRLFPPRKEVRWIVEDKRIKIDAVATVTRYTSDGCFEIKKAYPGDQLLIKKSGEWKVLRSLKGALVKRNQLKLKKSKKEKSLGYIDRKTPKVYDYVECFKGVEI